MAQEALEARIVRLLEGPLEGMGYEVVRVRLSGGGHGRTLQVMVERADRAGMTVDDCAEVSRTASALLDVEDPIEGAYSLEVSSPGIDRPLTRPADFERFAGCEAKLETKSPIDGRRRFRGRLLGLSDGRVRIALADVGGEAEVRFEDIDKAKLVVTDELLSRDLGAERAS